MLPCRHALIAIAVGSAGWWITGKPAACWAAMGAGVLPDIDHFVDYAYYRWRGDHRLILPLHGYEFAALGTAAALLTDSGILGFAALSYLIHLLADQFENRTRVLGYSLLFRARRQFRIQDISTVPEAAIRGRMEDMRQFGKVLHR